MKPSIASFTASDLPMFGRMTLEHNEQGTCFSFIFLWVTQDGVTQDDVIPVLRHVLARGALPRARRARHRLANHERKQRHSAKREQGFSACQFTGYHAGSQTYESGAHAGARHECRSDQRGNWDIRHEEICAHRRK